MRDKSIVGIAITEVVDETEKAVLVRFPEERTHAEGNVTDTHWFPLSRITRITHPCAANEGKGVLYLESWLVEQNFPDDYEEMIVVDSADVDMG
ncbi:MAG: hypothetical protein ING66_07410 [Rhodocyclaceae bacterium]|nr:hypothetical protein [Rhodocyclaceae bacterium]MCA3061025.1 hypothetical protein [Rhodocyclaceae bacterium]MCA3081204.1 hypothetical protein [Rhodocyclaceae bacterium]